VYKCRFSDNEGKESKRLSKFDLFCCLSDNEDVLNSLPCFSPAPPQLVEVVEGRKAEKKGERPTATHLLLIKGKIPPPCKIRVSNPLGLG